MAPSVVSTTHSARRLEVGAGVGSAAGAAGSTAAAGAGAGAGVGGGAAFVSAAGAGAEAGVASAGTAVSWAMTASGAISNTASTTQVSRRPATVAGRGAKQESRCPRSSSVEIMPAIVVTFGQLYNSERKGAEEIALRVCEQAG
ncbi:hypothetical protein DB346_15375 [Verrucomicrobia bacterium LW23]|nr:hypothetical protein DB346_15375 [Verrucomicrobia bacterium LW23]